MRERVLLVAAVFLLVSGLGAWTLAARRRMGVGELVTVSGPTPLVDGPPAPAEAPAAAARHAFELGMLGGLPVAEVLVRAGVPVFGLDVPGREAIAVWDRLRGGAAATGQWPLVLGDGWSVRVHADRAASTSEPPEAIVRRARTIDVDAWLASRTTGTPSAPPALEPAADRFELTRDRTTGLPLGTVTIALLPTRVSEEAPAWLSFGNWRGCPEPAEHVAVLRRWAERWGAEVVAVDPDAIELYVARPPTTPEDALVAAREMVAYAPAIVSARLPFDAIARHVAPSHVWKLRWPR